MRELTKSTLSAGLAMTLFGMQTMMGMFRGRRPDGRNPTVEALDAVTQTMVEQSGDALRETFQVGDRIQRQIVDMTFQLLTLAPMRSSGRASTMAGVAQQATGWMRNMMGSMGDNPCGPCGGGTGASKPPSSGWTGPQSSGAPPGGASGQGREAMPGQPTAGWQATQPSTAPSTADSDQEWGPMPYQT